MSSLNKGSHDAVDTATLLSLVDGRLLTTIDNFYEANNSNIQINESYISTLLNKYYPKVASSCSSGYILGFLLGEYYPWSKTIGDIEFTQESDERELVFSQDIVDSFTKIFGSYHVIPVFEEVDDFEFLLYNTLLKNNLITINDVSYQDVENVFHELSNHKLLDNYDYAQKFSICYELLTKICSKETGFIHYFRLHGAHSLMVKSTLKEELRKILL